MSAQGDSERRAEGSGRPPREGGDRPGHPGDAHATGRASGRGWLALAAASGAVALACGAFALSSAGGVGSLGALFREALVTVEEPAATSGEVASSTEAASGAAESGDAGTGDAASATSSADSEGGSAPSAGSGERTGVSSGEAGAAGSAALVPGSGSSGGASGSAGAQGGSTSHAPEGGPGSDSGAEAPRTITVSVSIDGSAAGGLSLSETMSLAVGSTVYDALAATGVDFNAASTAYGMYVSSIGGLAEKEHGSMSGWLYAVNGVTPSKASSAYKLSDGDSVSWWYANVEY